MYTLFRCFAFSAVVQHSTVVFYAKNGYHREVTGKKGMVCCRSRGEGGPCGWLCCCPAVFLLDR